VSTLDFLNDGEARARGELELAPDQALSEAELGTALKYALAASLADLFGGVAEIRRAARGGALTVAELRVAAAKELRKLAEAARQADHPIWAEHLGRPVLQARIADLAIDALLSERLAPEIILAPGSRALSPHPPLHALVFSAFTHCAHELYSLLVDALTAGVHAAGAHESWVAEGTLRRAILLDAEADRLLEVDLDPPASVASAQALALDLTREAESHQKIESALTVPLTNPYAGARCLDDKVWTAAAWANAGLEAPAYLSFAPDAADGEMRAVLADWLCSHTPALVVKPADGTEGRGVELVDFGRPGGGAACFAHLNRLIARGPALVMEERGQLRFTSSQGAVRFTLRLNVCWDGDRAWAESGCAQAAGDPAGIASAGRGGRVTPLIEVWQNLQRSDGTPFTPTAADWQTVLGAAEAGTAALARAIGPAMSRLIGIDLLLDLEADRIVPVLLEANPRPAGMSHARFVTAAGPTVEPGVTRRMWGTL